MTIMSFYRLNLTVIVSLLSLTSSCQNQELEEPRKISDLGPCDVARKTVKVAKDVKGRVTVLDVDHPSLWVIVSEQGVIGVPGPVFDGPDIVIPCNMPDSLKKYDLKVVFSGDLKESQDGLPSGTSKLYYSSVTSIRLTTKKFE